MINFINYVISTTNQYFKIMQVYMSIDKLLKL